MQEHAIITAYPTEIPSFIPSKVLKSGTENSKGAFLIPTPTKISIKRVKIKNIIITMNGYSSESPTGTKSQFATRHPTDVVNLHAKIQFGLFLFHKTILRKMPVYSIKSSLLKTSVLPLSVTLQTNSLEVVQ